MEQEILFENLRNLSTQWNSSRIIPRQVKSDGVPEGKYKAKIVKAYVDQTKQGKLCLKWQFEILDIDYAGATIWRQSLLVTDANIKWLKKDLFICGVEMYEPTELMNVSEKLVGLLVKIQIKKVGEFVNVYINEKLDSVNNKEIPF